MMKKPSLFLIAALVGAFHLALPTVHADDTAPATDASGESSMGAPAESEPAHEEAPVKKSKKGHKKKKGGKKAHKRGKKRRATE